MLALDSNISPNESASQVITEDSTIPSSAYDPITTGLRNPKPESAWVWSQYKVTPLETTWTLKGKGKGKSKTVNDCLISCGQCKWSTKDSLRHNATLNMIRHLLVEHKISSDSSSTLSTPYPLNNKDVIETFEKNLI